MAAREKELWKTIAFATRYGHITLTEAVHLDTYYLRLFCEGLAEIVQEENKRSDG